MAVLAYLSSAEIVFPVEKPLSIVGRAPESDLQLESRSVSWRHASMKWDERRGGILITDLDSRNGTFVNDNRLLNTSSPLGFGDVLRFGYDIASFRLERADQPSGGPTASGRQIDTADHVISAGQPSSQPALSRSTPVPTARTDRPDDDRVATARMAELAAHGDISSRRRSNPPSPLPAHAEERLAAAVAADTAADGEAKSAVPQDSNRQDSTARSAQQLQELNTRVIELEKSLATRQAAQSNAVAPLGMADSSTLLRPFV